MHVAVIGMGNMGRAFATRALERGHRVVVWNRSPGRAGAVVARGAAEASLESAVGDADVVLLVLSDDEAVLEVCRGDNGIVASLGSSAVLVNVSTVSPETVRHLAAIGPVDRVLDAPVMGAPENVAAGHGRFFVGRTTSDHPFLPPALDRPRRRVHPLRCGRHGLDRPAPAPGPRAAPRRSRRETRRTPRRDRSTRVSEGGHAHVARG